MPAYPRLHWLQNIRSTAAAEKGPWNILYGDGHSKNDAHLKSQFCSSTNMTASCPPTSEQYSSCIFWTKNNIRYICLDGFWISQKQTPSANNRPYKPHWELTFCWLDWQTSCTPRNNQHKPRAHPRNSPRQTWKESLYSLLSKGSGLRSKGGCTSW